MEVDPPAAERPAGDEEESEEEDDVPSICVAIRNSDQLVEIFIDEMPEDESLLLDLLRAEVAPLEIWHRFALEYYRQGRRDAFRNILREAKEGFQHFDTIRAIDKAELDKSRLEILNALMADKILALMTMRCIDDADNKEHEQLREEIMAFMSEADRIQPMFKLTWSSKALFGLICNNLENSVYWADMVLKEQADNIPAKLVKAAALYHNNKHEAALKLYEEVLISKPDCHASVRVGIGMCCIQLGQTARAKAAFERALALDPDNVEASVGIALLEMSTIPREAKDRIPRQKAAVKRISALAHRGVTDPMVLNHEANHAFWKLTRLRGWACEVQPGSDEVLCRFVASEEEIAAAAEEGEQATLIMPANIGDRLVSGVRVRLGARTPDGVWIGRPANSTAFEVVLQDPVETVEDGSVLRLRLSRAWDGDEASNVQISSPDFKRVEHLATHGFYYTKVSAIKAESYFLLGRALHARKQYQRAQQYYTGAIENAQQAFAPAHYGLAQLHLKEGEYSNAILCLENCIKDCPDTPEALHLLGMLHRHQSKPAQALEYLRKAAALNPTNPDIWITKAQVLHAPVSGRDSRARMTAASTSETHDAYATAVRLLREKAHQAELLDAPAKQAASRKRARPHASSSKDDPNNSSNTTTSTTTTSSSSRAKPPVVSPHILSNLGVLQAALGRADDARASMLEALRAWRAVAPSAGGGGVGGDQPGGDTTAAPLVAADPANAVFWEWEALPGEVQVSLAFGDATLATSTDLRALGARNGDHLQVSFPNPKAAPTETLGNGLSAAADLAPPMPNTPPRVNVRVEVANDKPITARAVPLKHPSLCRVPVHAGVTPEVVVERKAARLELNEMTVTAAFNLAVLHEAFGEGSAALELYKAIIIKFPNNVDALLRLAALRQKLGQSKAALEACHHASKLAPDEAAPLALLGSLHMQPPKGQAKGSTSKRLELAQKAFEGIQKLDEKALRSDPFANIGMGNIFFHNIHAVSDPTAYSKQLSWAEQYFKHVLKANASNVFACNGLGLVLAEKGHIKQARDIFSRIKTAAASIVPDAVVNLAHLMTLNDEHLQAVKLYAGVLKKHHQNHDPELLLYIAHAHFNDGKHVQALRALSKALHIAPQDLSLWLNVGSLQHAYSTILFESAGGESVEADINAAQAFAASALRIFVWLKQSKEDFGEDSQREERKDHKNIKSLPIDDKKLDELVAMCQRSLRDAPRRIEQARHKAQELLSAREQQKRLMDEARSRQQAQEELRHKEEQTKREQEQQRARQRQELAMERMAQAAADAAAAKAAEEAEDDENKKRRKKRKKGEEEEELGEPQEDILLEEDEEEEKINQGRAMEEDEEAPADQVAEGASPPPARPQTAKVMEDLGLSDSEDEAAPPPPSQGQAGPAASSPAPAPAASATMSSLGLTDSEDEAAPPDQEPETSADAMETVDSPAASEAAAAEDASEVGDDPAAASEDGSRQVKRRRLAVVDSDSE